MKQIIQHDLKEGRMVALFSGQLPHRSMNCCYVARTFRRSVREKLSPPIICENLEAEVGAIRSWDQAPAVGAATSVVHPEAMPAWERIPVGEAS